MLIRFETENGSLALDIPAGTSVDWTLALIAIAKDCIERHAENIGLYPSTQDPGDELDIKTRLQD